MTVKEYIDAIIRISDDRAEADERLKEKLGELLAYIEERHKPAEPKEFWYILPNGGVVKMIVLGDDSETHKEFEKDCRKMGNYFETKEEAEKTIEELKAWKTLRENKVHFDLATLSDENTITIFARKKGAIHVYDKELSLLFGNDIDRRKNEA